MEFIVDINTLFPNEYLRPDDLDGDTNFTIRAVECRELRERSGQNVEKPVAYFKETDKGLPLNKTNATSILALYGKETEAWIGRQVTLYVTPVSTPEGLKDGIRVRDSVPNPEQEALQF
jgi:hypothetical protein